MLKPRARDRMFKRAVGLLVIFSVLMLLFFLRIYQQTAAPFKQTIHLYSTIDRADGIAINAPVTMAGLKVGRVTEINLTDDNQVRLGFEIDHKFAHKLRADSLATLFKPLIGSASVDIRLGAPAQPALADGGSIPSAHAPDINDVIATLPAKLEKVDSTLNNLAALSSDLRRLSSAATNGESSVEKTLAHLQATARQAEGAVGKLNLTLDDTRQTIKSIGQAASKTNLALDDIRAGTARLGPIAEKADKTMDDLLILSRELRGVAPQIPPMISSGHNVLHEADDVLQAARNNFLLRGNLPGDAALPMLPPPR